MKIFFRKTPLSLFLITFLLIILGSCAILSNTPFLRSPLRPSFRSLTCDKHQFTLKGINKVSLVYSKEQERYFNQLKEKYRIPGRFFAPDPAEFTKWFYARGRSVKGVAVIVHGLNLRPSKMNNIVYFLQERGIDVLRVSLTGHRGDFREIYLADREQWLYDMFGAYCLALYRTSAYGQKLPIYFVGYSLGGLINLDLMTEKTKEAINYDRMILFAPAIAIHGTIKFARWLARALGIFTNPYSFYPSKPSGYGRDYLRYYLINPKLPILAYDALFNSVSAINKKRFSNLNIPTVVFIDPRDELVSVSEILRIVDKHKLDLWDIIEVSSQDSILGEEIKTSDDKKIIANPLHHSITDADLMGEEWQFIQKVIESHLNLRIEKK